MKPVRLVDLEPEWVSYSAPGRRQRSGDLTAETAQGVLFICPFCFDRLGGPVGAHSVLAWFRGRGVPDDESPGPGRWTITGGSTFADLTLQPSIDLGAGDWHGWITAGVCTSA